MIFPKGVVVPVGDPVDYAGKEGALIQPVMILAFYDSSTTGAVVIALEEIRNRR